MRRPILVLSMLALGRGLTAQTAPADGVREFRVDDAWGRDTVEFRTTAPLEDIVGTSNQVTGVLRADPKNLKGPATAARIEVDIGSIRTGIETRDGHVARALGAPKSPVALFTLEKIRSASPNVLEPNIPADIVAEGTFELNGAAKKLEVAARLTYVPKGGPFSRMRPGNFVRIVAQFDLRLVDFGVERSGPTLPLQVGETAHVTVTALASDASAEEAAEYRQRAIQYLGKAQQRPR